MKLIVGLGNPGRSYAKTRHNVGFRVVEMLARRLGADIARSKFKGLYGTAALPESQMELLLVKPQTYMNLSGVTVQGFCGFYHVALNDLLVVVDDVNLSVGSLRLRPGGSAGGHNGLKDIILRLGRDDFARLWIGVGGRVAGQDAQAPELVGHVLGRFDAADEALLEKRLPEAVEACCCWACLGVEAAMNKYNAAAN